MHIKNIKLNNFRNYTEQEVVLGRGVNVFVGQNAQGKTNLLETAVLCSIGRSLRASKDRELIGFGSERAKVRCEVVKRFGTESVEIELSKAQSKRIVINGLPASKVGELMGVLNTVYFSPDELRLIKDGPMMRRRFMDIAISQLSKTYFFTLQKYTRILNQRNKLLKSKDLAGLDIWDAQLSREGAKIMRTRQGFLKRLAGKAEAVHSALTSNSEQLTLNYEGIEGQTTEQIGAAFLQALQAQKHTDIRLGYTGVGAQKDDFAICINGVDTRAYGSQGQQRTAALSLKLAELEILQEESGEAPVLLLDDVFSELDTCRRQQLLQRLHGFQTIITCTDLDNDLINLTGEIQVYNIENGKILS